MKFSEHRFYDPRHSELSHGALLSAWGVLAEWGSKLVVVGGLVPRYICIPPDLGGLPRPQTTDVDIGIAFGAQHNDCPSLVGHLRKNGFECSRETEERVEWNFNGLTVVIDFLTESPPETDGSKLVGDLQACVMPGINRALACNRRIRLSGVNLHLKEVAYDIPVCEIGPFIMLKLRAFERRKEPKDAFDILYTLRHYDGGTLAAVAAFAAEVRADNTACADALLCLERHFADAASPAPAKAAYFVYGERTPDESSDQAFRRAQIANEMVMAGKMLRDAVSNPI